VERSQKETDQRLSLVCGFCPPDQVRGRLLPLARTFDSIHYHEHRRVSHRRLSPHQFTLLNVQAFTDPTAYKLKVKRPGSDESSEVNVDLLETFNWLIGLTVKHIAAPQSFSADFERDSEKRLRLKGRLGQIPHRGPLPGISRVKRQVGSGIGN
jgi:hypothetical protein